MFADAEAYERFTGRWSRLVAPRLLDFVGLPNRSRVLDVGAGTGSLALEIGERVDQAPIVGIDLSKEYVAYASAKNPFPNRANFEIGDAQQLHFADSSFDVTVSLLAFNFIPDPGKALRELRRVTKPGGSISAAVWDYGSGMGMLRILGYRQHPRRNLSTESWRIGVTSRRSGIATCESQAHHGLLSKHKDHQVVFTATF